MKTFMPSTVERKWYVVDATGYTMGRLATEIASTWSHTRPDGSSWSTVFDQYGVSWGGGIAENLAYISYSEAADVVYSWMNSSGHKANILNGSYSEIGVGVYYSGGNYYICTLFRA